jgi:hypothetical protein
MVAPKSSHLPEVAGAIETFTGLLEVDTGLREVQSFTATLAQASAVASAQVTGILLDVVAGQTQKVRLQVWQSDLATQSVTSAKVAWLAFGK